MGRCHRRGWRIAVFLGVSGELLFRQPADQNVTIVHYIENLPPSHFARDRRLEDKHKPEGHVYQRDQSPLQWRGWHAFRRGLATNLHALGIDDKTIQAILRHSNVSLTQNIYVKSVMESQVSAMDSLSEKLAKNI